MAKIGGASRSVEGESLLSAVARLCVASSLMRCACKAVNEEGGAIRSVTRKSLDRSKSDALTSGKDTARRRAGARRWIL